MKTKDDGNNATTKKRKESITTKQKAEGLREGAYLQGPVLSCFRCLEALTIQVRGLTSSAALLPLSL